MNVINHELGPITKEREYTDKAGQYTMIDNIESLAKIN